MTGVWVAADTISATRMNEKTIFIGTGAAISGLTTTYAGMLAFSTSTGNGFTINHHYQRNAANDAWREVPVIEDITPASGDIVYFSGTDYSVKRPTLEMLDNHLASGAEATYTYTPGTALSGDTYSKIVVEFDGEATASFALQGVINGVVGTSNSSYGYQTVFSAITFVGTSSTSVITLGTTALIGGVLEIAGNLDLRMTQGASRSRILGESSFNTSDGAQHFFHNIVDTSDSITSIKIQTSTSTWKTGTRITTYGVRRD